MIDGAFATLQMFPCVIDGSSVTLRMFPCVIDGSSATLRMFPCVINEFPYKCSVAMIESLGKIDRSTIPTWPFP